MYGRHLDPLTDSRPATVEQTHKITITKKKKLKKIRTGLCTLQLKISCQTNPIRDFQLALKSNYKK